MLEGPLTIFLEENNLFPNVLLYICSGCPVKDCQNKDFEGTPVYAPPEWVENNSYLAEDMGILLFDMVCGNVPFMEERQIVEGKLEWVSDVSVELRDLIESCLCHDPRERMPLMDILKHPWFLWN